MATSGACDPTRPLHVQIWLAFRYRRRSLRLGTVSRRYVYARQNDRKVGAGRGGRIPPWRIRITRKFVASREMRLRAFAFREAGKINPKAPVPGRRALNLPLEVASAGVASTAGGADRRMPSVPESASVSPALAGAHGRSKPFGLT